MVVLYLSCKPISSQVVCVHVLISAVFLFVQPFAEMSVVLEFDDGWFVDHLVSINKDFEKTDSVCRTDRNFPENEVDKIERQGCGNENKLVSDERRTLKYECNPNLFAIWQPFMMDSQFEKTMERQNSENSCTLENITEKKAS